MFVVAMSLRDPRMKRLPCPGLSAGFVWAPLWNDKPMELVRMEASKILNNVSHLLSP
jgi:hypothetical protein